METEPLLQKVEESAESGVKKSQIKNLLLGNMILFISTLAVSMFSPAMSQYLYKRVTEDEFRNQTLAGKGPMNQTCYLNTSNPDYILQEKAQQVTADKQMQFTFLRTSLAIVSNIMLGSYSDSVGRKLLFVVPLTGHCLRFGLTAVIMYWNLDINWFFLPEGLEGISGTYYAMLLASFAYTADNTPATGARTMGIAFVEFFKSIGSAASETATGYFIQDVNFFYPTLTATLIVLVDILLVVTLLPERNGIKKAKSKWITPLEGCRRVFGFYVLEGTKRKRLCFVLAILIFVFTALPTVGSSNIDTLFKLNLPFCWTPEKIGYYSTISSVAQQVIGVPLTRLLQCCCIDEVIGVIGSVAIGLADSLQSIVSKDWMMYGLAGIKTPSATLFPVVRSTMSKMAPANKQGSLFASLAVVETMCSLVGTSVFNGIYQATVVVWRGMVFIVLGGTYIVAAILLVVYIFVSKPIRLKRDVLKVQRDVQQAQPEVPHVQRDVQQDQPEVPHVQRDVQQDQPGVPHVQRVVTVHQGTQTDITVDPDKHVHALSATDLEVAEVTRASIHVHAQSEFGEEDGDNVKTDG
ncbi:solute carrier family 46 member 3-like [Haliotis rubra]|uniref:solute carrier family 46 member 3-like n=1 Tax=Haliotis rubra TaxID=36100 RepID=UPI001EE57B3E|nr:solute carrier family 46 member 3-like [Haliotis rubra]